MPFGHVVFWDFPDEEAYRKDEKKERWSEGGPNGKGLDERRKSLPKGERDQNEARVTGGARVKKETKPSR